MKSAIFPGTFDPPTIGHKNIIERASKLFPRLTIAIGNNIQKNSPIFSIEERIEMLKKICNHLPNIEIIKFKGLLVDFVKENSTDVIIRSLRNTQDFDYETTMAHMNKKLGNVETVYLMADYPFISSSLLNEILKFGSKDSLKPFVPEEIITNVFNRLTEKVEKV